MIPSSKTVKVLVPVVLGLSATLVSLTANLVTGTLSQARTLPKLPLLLPFDLKLAKPPLRRTQGVRGPAPGVKATILYSFDDKDGTYPLSSPDLDKTQKKIYGTTFQGGADDYGTVFAFPINNPPATGKLNPLHSFKKDDGANPMGRLILDSTGKIYGTTNRGGANGQGTVFTFDATGKPITPQQHSFIGSDGLQPTAGVQRDTKGNLYGTTPGGGKTGYGTAFELAPGGKLTSIYSFSLSTARPYGGVLRDSSGMYGTTYLGGKANKGIVFKIFKGKFTVLQNFTGTNGAYPYSTLVRDGAGKLYGTTCKGGDFNYGTVFRLNADGKEFKTLHSFNFVKGSCPITGVVLDQLGNLYGTTYEGGSDANGTVFKIAAGGEFTSLYSFDNSVENDGDSPWGGVTLDNALLTSGKGNLYGTTQFGGEKNRGSVFKLNLK
ncbi:MAG: choice-of-anchor tandem repeat GloVer-containing protein [Thermosynechococcaceae cyanobacterium]